MKTVYRLEQEGPDKRFMLNIAGEYGFELTVFDLVKLRNMFSIALEAR